MVIEQLNIAYEVFENKNKSLDSDEYFTQIKNFIAQAVKENQQDVVEQLLTNHLKSFVIGDKNKEVFYLLKEYEHYFHNEAKKLLGLYYRMLGHILYFRFEFEKANYYYKHAISYSLENKDYVGLATAMNNFTHKNFNTFPVDVGLTLARSIPLILKIGNAYAINDLISKLFFYIEFAIRKGKIQHIELLLQNIIDGDYVRGNERYELHLKIIQGIFWEQKGDPIKAKELYLEVLERCVHPDLLIRVYQEIINLRMDCEQLDQSLFQIVNKLERTIKAESRLILKYLEKDRTFKPLKFNRTFGIKPEQFKFIASIHLKNVENVGNTLLLMDCLLTTPGSDNLLEILTLLNDEMTAEFGESILIVTIIDESSVAYILPLSEAEVDCRIRNVFEKVRRLYPKEQSNLKDIYYASINNKENNLTNFEDCLNLAYAYIYYELK